MKQLIVTADDFGLCSEVNEAVITAHTRGILTCASLMVGAPASEDAVTLAKQIPSLKVGLHLTLVEGHSVLPKQLIPDLVDENQRFSSQIVRSGFRYFFSKKIKEQMTQECEAQIENFLSTGLKMDHLNSHNHFHIHPSIQNIVIDMAKKYKIHAIRLPRQNWHMAAGPAQMLMTTLMLPWVAQLRKKLHQSNIAFNDETFGLLETGSMIEEAWVRIIPQIKEGITEVYCHPAVKTAGILKETMPSYLHAEELRALLSSEIKNKLDEAKIKRIGFGDLEC